MGIYFQTHFAVIAEQQAEKKIKKKTKSKRGTVEANVKYPNNQQKIGLSSEI